MALCRRPAEGLIFWENYLGSLERSITLNFSKGASNIIAQYYQFLRLGFAGYRKIMLNLDIVRKRLINAINRMGGCGVVGQVGGCLVLGGGWGGKFSGGACAPPPPTTHIHTHSSSHPLPPLQLQGTLRCCRRTWAFLSWPSALRRCWVQTARSTTGEGAARLGSGKVV